MDTLNNFAPTPAARAALWESIAAAIRRAIILGELPPGLHLEEPALAEKFGVSRIPIREALARLAHEGLVRTEPRRGAFVVGMSDTDISNIYELRMLLEQQAVRRVVERFEPEDREQLDMFVALMAESVRQGQPHLMAEPDLNFHRRIIELAGNRWLMAAWEPIGGLVATILSITDTTHHDLPSAVEGHRRIVQALELRDRDRAEREMRRHLEGGEETMRTALRIIRENKNASPGQRVP